jgi:hypothetical protein
MIVQAQLVERPAERIHLGRGCGRQEPLGGRGGEGMGSPVDARRCYNRKQIRYSRPPHSLVVVAPTPNLRVVAIAVFDLYLQRVFGRYMVQSSETSHTQRKAPTVERSIRIWKRKNFWEPTQHTILRSVTQHSHDHIQSCHSPLWPLGDGSRRVHGIR